MKHILAVRRIPIFSHTVAVLIFESNLAFESQHLLHALESNNVKRWVSLSEGQAGTLGWLTVRNLLLSTLAWSDTQPRCVSDE